MNRQSDSEGFSAIELLVVITLIALLTTIAVPAMRSAERAAREKRAIANMKSLINSQTIFYSSNRRFAIPDELFQGGYLTEGQLVRPVKDKRGQALTAASEALSDGCYEYSFRYDRNSQ